MPISLATRKAAVQQAVAVQQGGPARARSEAAATPVTKGMAPRTAKLETVQTQAVKPGSRMPRLDLPPQELDAVTAYVETLK